MSKFMLTFDTSFAGVSAGSTFTRDENSLGIITCKVNLSHQDVLTLVESGVIDMEKVSEPMTINTTCVEYDKLSKAVAKDFAEGNFSHEDEYLFYSIEAKAWKVSKLLKTASHLGRVGIGFAIPYGSDTKKKRNRLNNLNAVFALGLTQSEIRTIAETTPTNE